MTKSVFRLAPLISIICLLVNTQVSRAQGLETLIDRVICVVDARPIFHSDIQRKIDVGPAVIVSEFPSDKDAPIFDRALNDAINMELILSASRDLDIEVSDADLDQEIVRFMEEQKLTKDKLIELLAAQGETFESYKIDFRNQLVLRRFQRKVIAPSIKVTEKDIETYYMSQSGSITSDSIEVTFQQIVMNMRADQPKEIQEARKNLVQELSTKLKGSLDFSEAAGLYSDESAEIKGRLITLKVKDLASSIRGVIEPMKPGEVIGPINVGQNYVFFKMNDRKVSLNRDFEAKKQVLEQELKMIELRNQTNKWLAEQRQRSTIKMN